MEFFFPIIYKLTYYNSAYALESLLSACTHHTMQSQNTASLFVHLKLKDCFILSLLAT